jgi:Fe-S cluster assembly iron-binding protein IscA
MLLSNIENAKLDYKEKINSIFRLHMPNHRGNIISNNISDRAFYNFKH